MSWGADALQVTEDTFQMIKAATSGITTTTGIAGIDLIRTLVSWVPVDTPFFNSTPRGPASMGATRAIFEALANVNTQQPTGGTKMNYASPLAKVESQWVYSPFAKVGIGGTVSQDALAQAEGYATVLAVDTLQTVNQVLIALEIHQLNAQSFACPTVGTPTLTLHSSGGTIATGKKVTVKVAVRSGVNWYRGGASVPGTTAHVTTTAGTSSVTASVTAVKLAAGYDWYVKYTTGLFYYYTTTPVNTVTITKKITANANIPTTYAGLYKAGQAGPNAATTATTSQTYWQNGLLASILGDFDHQPTQAFTATNGANLTTPGSGTSQGSYYQSLTGAALSVQGAGFAQIDTMNRKIYDKWQISPSRLLMGSQVITDFANAFLDNPQAVLWLRPDAADGRLNGTMGGHVAQYGNKTVDGKTIELHLMPYLPPGKIVAVVDSLPFPGANVSSSLQVRTLYDFFRFDYGANRTLTSATGGPRYDFEVACNQAFVNRASVTMGVLDCIGAGVA